MSLSEVFQWLQSGQKTGTLRIKGPQGVTKDVFFNNGLISSAASSDPRESIGQFLLFTRRITEKQLSDALENQKQDHLLLGRILVKKGLLNKDELSRVLLSISEEIIYDLFLWKEGEFEFIDGDLPEREMVSLNLDITHIVLEGATREDEWQRIKRVFPNEMCIVRPIVEKIATRLPLESGLTRLLLLINGKRNLNEISKLHKATKYELFKSLLDLHDVGFIEVGSYLEQVIWTGKGEEANPVESLVSEIEKALQRCNLSEAEQKTDRLEGLTGPTRETVVLRGRIEEKRFETTAKELVNPNSVPSLNIGVDKLTKMDLSPEQGFLVSRINGVWDVKSIMKISPFGETTCLKILKKFMDDGVIKLK